MLKHVQISPLRNRADSVSLRSSTSCASSLCGSPEPPLDQQIRTSSRASSYCSLNETVPQTTIKVYTSCLRLDIEYKTLGIQWDTTSKEVVAQLLRRCKMRQRDPRLFYLSMEVTVRRAGVRTVLVLDDEARPAILQACHPKGDSKFYLQLKPGGVIRVHTTALQPTSQYKSLVISEETTSDELLLLLLSTYNSNEPVERYSLYEVCPGQEYQRKLHPDDLPLRTHLQRTQKGEQCHFLVRKNPHYPRRKQILPPINEKQLPPLETNFYNSIVMPYSPNTITTTTTTSATNIGEALDSISSNNTTTTISTTISNISDDNSLINGINKCEISSCQICPPPSSSVPLQTETFNDIPQMAVESLNRRLPPPTTPTICKMCKNNFKSCEFCNKSASYKLSARLTCNASPIEMYSPVYNIREIRTVCNSFSSLGIDKKLLDIQYNGTMGSTVQLAPIQHRSSLALSSSSSTSSASTAAAAAAASVELTNTDPARGVGNFVYV